MPAELKQVHITGIAEYAELYLELKRVLQRSGSQLSARPESAKSVINISGEEFRKRVLSVDAQGRAAEYELDYRFTFSVHTNEVKQENTTDKSVSDKKILVPAQQINLTRDFRFDPNNILATDAQERQIRLEMVRFAVQQVIRRIRSHLKHTTKAEIKSET